VRQLQNIIEGATVFARGDQIELDNLPEEVRLGFDPENATGNFDWLEQKIADGSSLDEIVAMIEKEMIMRMLQQAEGNQSKAAQMLGIKRGTLQYKMKTYQIS
jgi:DNA-binding NtrC family response regulator